MKKNLIKYIILALYIILIGIFYFFTLKTGDESAKESSFVTDVIIKLLRFITFKRVSFDYDIIHHITRKLVGHYGYNVLIGIMGFLAMFLMKDKGNFALVISASLGLVVAIIGELLQFIPAGRGPSLIDALFNFLGELTGVLLIYVIIEIIQNKNKKTI